MQLRKICATSLAIFGLISSAAVLAESHEHEQVCDAAPLDPVQPLLTVSDVTGDGTVNGNDVQMIRQHMLGIKSGNKSYHALYDRDADGDIDINDVKIAMDDQGSEVPVTEMQVAKTALATMRYTNLQNAIDDGYVPVTQYVPFHGIHWSRLDLGETEFDIETPTGLNYSKNGKLTAVFWLVDPKIFGYSIPAGFAGHHDKWHHHIEICGYSYYSEEACKSAGGAKISCKGLDRRIPFLSDKITERLEDLYGIVIDWEGETTCQNIKPFLVEQGFVSDIAPDEQDDYEDFWSDEFYMLHLWTENLNPCGRFAGTHPGE